MPGSEPESRASRSSGWARASTIYPGLPLPAKKVIGFALRQAQNGGRHVGAKPIKGYGGAGVLEIVTDHQTDTFRAVYTVKFKGAVYVLHAFQKKTKSGIKTPKADLDLVASRLRSARKH
jgi:phage-related protein